MPREDMLNRLEEIAHRVSKVHPAENAEIAFVNIMPDDLLFQVLTSLKFTDAIKERRYGPGKSVL